MLSDVISIISFFWLHAGTHLKQLGVKEKNIPFYLRIWLKEKKERGKDEEDKNKQVRKREIQLRGREKKGS